MGGLGDCLHQRAVLRQLMQRRTVTLMTPWPAMYHDLIAEGLIVVRRGIALRTQMKNEQREAAKFTSRHPLTRSVGGTRIAYGGQQVLQTPSKTVLEVMCNVTGTDFATADFRLPIPEQWTADLDKKLGPLPLDKPIMALRPLVSRTEYRGSTLRNADPASYQELVNLVRDKGDFFVISIADLEEGKEWLVSDIKADLTLHKGELVFEEMAALFCAADLVFTSSGFGAVLGPAVETPTISIIGGYEDVRCHDAGKKFAPYLAIGPKSGCSCWISQCQRTCDKSLDMDFARGAVSAFTENILCPSIS